jgi:hypothetical protein
MPLLTLGQAYTAKVRLIVWYRTCLHRFEPDTATLAEQQGAATTVLAWARRLRVRNAGRAMRISSSAAPRFKVQSQHTFSEIADRMTNRVVRR